MTIARHQDRAESLLRAAGILPVVTVDSVDQAHRLADALLGGGLTALELTLRTPAALAAITALKKALPEIVIGAGTVLDARQAQSSIDAGADFLVTPGTPQALADALAALPVPVVPGGATPTEFMQLMARGFRCCKLFPASAVGGLAMVRGLAGPLAGLVLCPTGGITEANAAEYLSQRNVACIGGSWMLKPEWLAAGDWDSVRRAARGAADLLGGARGA